MPSETHYLDLSALGFQALATLALAAVHLGLWRQRGERFHATWAWAWLLYVGRLAAISAYLVHRQEVWLFFHQACAMVGGLLLLLAARQFSGPVRWRPHYWLLGVLAVGWAAFSVFVIHDMAVAGTSGAIVLSGVTLWTGGVFWRHLRRQPSTGARILAWSFTLWGLHHLDYPLLRALGQGVLYGVFIDVAFIVLVAMGTLTYVLGEERAALERRTQQLEQLTQLLLRAQEEERRRIARELHDEAGQALTAVKIELDLEGRKEASALVARVLDQVRNVSNLLRPQALDDLGLTAALRAMIEDFGTRTRVDVAFAADDRETWPSEPAVALYRVAQEALTNVARHSGAQHAWVDLRASDGVARLVVEDDGQGLRADHSPHMGLLGMKERVGSAGGELTLGPSRRGGLRVEARVPLGGAS